MTLRNQLMIPVVAILLAACGEEADKPSKQTQAPAKQHSVQAEKLENVADSLATHSQLYALGLLSRNL